MATKVDTVPADESQPAQSPISKSASANSAGGPKVSMFGVKSGFVIPKNKLSGSLVPILRGGGKAESGDAGKEESTKQVQRKTRWGADLTQDASVRKGRSMAYQARVEQITQQLKSGSLELGEDQGSRLPGQGSNVDSVEQLTISKLHERDLLELEKREIIGEILRLNPSYKAPPDYKPLLKEAQVPIPLKAHPGYNFIGLILAPASNTQKRLEEETGAKVRVYGTKADTTEKCEITRSDAAEAHAVYDELHVQVSADSYEKVDAAVALIELLVTPVSGVPAVVSTTSSTVTGDSGNDKNQDSTSAYVTMPIGVVNQGTMQPVVMPAHPVLAQFQAYPGPWHSHGSPNAAIPPSAGFIRPSVSNNSMQFSSPMNPLIAPFSGGLPASSTVPRNLSPVVTRLEPPVQNLQRPLNEVTTPPGHAIAVQRTPSAYPAMPARTTPVLPAVSPPVPVGSMPAARPGPQPVPTPVGFLYNRPMVTPSGSSSGLSAAPLPLRSNNMMHLVPPFSIPPQRPRPMVPQSNVALQPQPIAPATAAGGPPATNFMSRASFPHQALTVPSNFPSSPHVGQVPASNVVPVPTGSSAAPSPGPTFLLARVPSPSPRPLSGLVPAASPTITSASAQVSPQVSVPTQSVPLSVTRPPVPVSPLPSGPASVLASLPVPSPQPIPAVSGSTLVSSQTFPPAKLPMSGPVNIPPIASPKPQHRSPGDFTFQPHRPQVSTSVSSNIPSSQPLPHTMSQVPPGAPQAPLNQNTSQLPLAPPKAPSFRPATSGPPLTVGMQGPQRPQGVGQMGPPQGLQPLMSAPGGPFPGNPTAMLAQPRPPAFLNANTPPNAQADPRSFSSAVPNVSGPIPSRPATFIQAHNQRPPGHQPHGLVTPNQHLASPLPSYVPGKPPAPGGSQIYDPFSPTSISSGPGQREDGPAKTRKPETDAEYEDLMASVGVR